VSRQAAAGDPGPKANLPLYCLKLVIDCIAPQSGSFALSAATGEGVLAWFLSVVVALLLSAAPATAQVGRRVALVIGNDTYQSLAPLDNPGLDAAKVAALLDANGFDVIRCDGQRLGCFNLSRDGLEEALDALGKKASGAELAVVFYAGHGMEGSRGNVLAPIDMEVSDCTERALRRAVPLNEVFNAVAGARRKIVILDACRNNPFAQCPPARGVRPVSFGDFSVSEVESFLLVSSTKPGQLASDGNPGAHSPFARALLNWLQQAPQVQFHQLLSHVAKDVIEDTARGNDTQVPEMVVRGGGADGCLKGVDCAGDLEAVALKQELEALKERHGDDQRVADTVRSYLAEAERGRPLSEAELRQVVTSFKQVGDLFVEVEKGQGRPFSRDEKAQELARLMEAGRALLALKDTRSERALELLKAGDETEAKRLFAEAAAARQEAARTAQSRAAEENREAAKALRNLAAIAKPKSIAEAADHYKQAAHLDPDDAQTWIDYGNAASDAGRTDEAKSAFEQADARARASRDVLVQIRAARGLASVAMFQSKHAVMEERQRAALALAEAASRGEPGNSVWQRQLSISHGELGRILGDRNDLPAALEHTQTSLVIAKRLVEEDPADGERQEDLARAHDRMGDVQKAQGDLAGALSSHQAELAIGERFNKAAPDKTEWLQLMWGAHVSIGDAHLVSRHDLVAALGSFREALAIARRLAEIDPTNIRFQLCLSLAHSWQGFVLQRQGDLAAALASSRATLDIAERLSRAAPGNLLLQQGLASAHNGVGGVLQAQGHYGEALSSYRMALDIEERVAAAEPGNNTAQALVASIHGDIGETLEAQGDLAGALASYRTAVAGFDKTDPSSTWRANQYLLHGRIGRILQKQGDLAGALASRRAEQAVAERMATARPGDLSWQNHLAFSHNSVGDVLRAQGKLADAVASFKAAQVVWEGVVKADPTGQHQQTLALAHLQVARALREQAELAGALASYQAALGMLGKLDTADANWQSILGEAHKDAGKVLRAQGDLAGALASYRAALAVAERLAKVEPGKTAWQVDLGGAHGNVAAVLELQGDLAGALAGYRAALDINDRLAKADPANADWQGNLFFWHSKVGGVLLRQGSLAEALSSQRTALGIAERLAKTNPANTGRQWSLTSSTQDLATVLYARGDRAGALAGWRKALAMAETRAAAVEQEETKAGGKPGKTTAEALGSLAYYAIYARNSGKALAAAERAHALAPDVIWPEVNRAIALMLLGRAREARALFLAHKGKSTLGDPWAAVVATDFRNLRGAGLAHPMMREVEAALGVTPQPARPAPGARRATK
jgi:tetratricopeptide (TPR) repeat protein